MAEKFFRMGTLRFSFRTPNGHDAVIMPEQLYFIENSEAVLDGNDLGAPLQLPENPGISDVALPTRPVFLIGQAFARRKNHDEYC